MTKITHPKEWEQYAKHNWEQKKTPQDKSYQTFLNSIHDEDGELNKIGGKDIPETITEICRVFKPMDGKEYLVYDVEQYGYFETGEKTPTIHLQEQGVWRLFEWNKERIDEGINTGNPKRARFKEKPSTNYTEMHDLEWNDSNIKPLVKKITPMTKFYVYDLGKSGRGGKDGKISIDSLDELKNHTFQELMEGTYKLRYRLEQEIKAAQQERASYETRRKLESTSTK